MFSFTRLLDICQSEGWELISQYNHSFCKQCTGKAFDLPIFLAALLATWWISSKFFPSSAKAPQIYWEKYIKIWIWNNRKKCTISGLCSLIFVCLYIESSLYQKLKPRLCTLWIRTVPHKPLLPAVLSDDIRAQSSPTTTMLTLSPSAFALSAARPKLSLSPV